MQTDRTSISAKVIADSVHAGSRSTTFEVVFPRFLLAEFNTHRKLSRNSASSRAIPVWKRIIDVLGDPFVPTSLGRNQAGMQAADPVAEADLEVARNNWIYGSYIAGIQAFMLAGGEEQMRKEYKESPLLLDLFEAIRGFLDKFPEVLSEMRPVPGGVHKQHANRVLEPYAWHTVIVTATDWRNFYALRASKMAQPEIREVAVSMATAHMESAPQELVEGEWHLPFIFNDDISEAVDSEKLARISAARCARVSYLTHDGKRSLDKDLSMADDLQKNGHMSPFEHPAQTRDTTGAFSGKYGGNFSGGWIQYRKMLDKEHDFSKLISRNDMLEGMAGDEELTDFVYSLPA